MKYQPATLSAADQVLAQAPEIGVESEVYVSYESMREVYAILQDDVDSGESLAVAGAYALPGSGVDLHLVCDNSVVSDGPLVVVLAVTDQDSGSTSATATFEAPEYANDQSDNFPLGTAVDMVVANGKKVAAITGITSVTGGRMGNRFRVFALPGADSWHAVGCTRAKDITLPVAGDLAIPCGRNPSRYVKSVRGETGMLSCEAAYSTYGDGLARLAGQRVTARIDTLRDDRVLVERTVLGGWRPKPQSPRPDGDDEVTTTAEGMFEQFAVFF